MITDKAKRGKIFRLITSGLWTFYGLMSLLRYLKTGDQFLLWTGLLIGIGHLGIFIAFLFKSVANEISFENIKSVELDQDNNLSIKLKNGRTRRVNQVYATQEFKEYITKFQSV